MILHLDTLDGTTFDLDEDALMKRLSRSLSILYKPSMRQPNALSWPDAPIKWISPLGYFLDMLYEGKNADGRPYIPISSFKYWIVYSVEWGKVNALLNMLIKPST